uniref:Uncharacterized protein n=1 Tax=Theileria annulata TaxID=5874 RepID=A0A3B0N408_THEAN
MNIILYDMKLCKLLEKLEDLRINYIYLRPKHINRCKKCILCNLEENIIKISKLICNLLKFNIKNLIIYLKFDKLQFIQSTITLNYIKSLYSSIITQYLLLYNVILYLIHLYTN